MSKQLQVIQSSCRLEHSQRAGREAREDRPKRAARGERATRGVFLAAAILVASALAGCGESSAAPDAAPDAAGLCSAEVDLASEGTPDGNLAGTWAVFTRYRAVVPGLSGGQIPRTYFLQEITDDGNGVLTMTETLCDLEVDSEGGTIRVRVTPAFISGVPAETRGGSVAGDGNGGFSYTLDPHVVVRGVTLDDPVNDPLPTDPEDPKIGDQDGDGNPGLTLIVSGVISGQMFVIQRDTSQFAGAMVSAKRVQGGVTWTSEQVYLGAEPLALLDLVREAIPDTDASKHTLRDGPGPRWLRLYLSRGEQMRPLCRRWNREVLMSSTNTLSKIPTPGKMLAQVTSFVLAGALAAAPSVHASPLYELLGGVTGSGGFNARVVGTGPDATYFNPALLPHSAEAFDFAVLGLGSSLTIDVDPRPSGEGSVDLAPSVYNAFLADGTGGIAPLLDSPKATGDLPPRQANSGDSGSRAYMAFGLVKHLVERQAGAGIFRHPAR